MRRLKWENAERGEELLCFSEEFGILRLQRCGFDLLEEGGFGVILILDAYTNYTRMYNTSMYSSV